MPVILARLIYLGLSVSGGYPGKSDLMGPYVLTVEPGCPQDVQYPLVSPGIQFMEVRPISFPSARGNL